MKTIARKLTTFGCWSPKATWLPRNFALFVVCYLLFALPAGAQQGNAGLRLEPALIEQNVQPGQTLSFTLRATNLDAITNTYYLAVRNITGLDSAGQPVLAKMSDAETAYAVGSWIVLASVSVEVEPGQTKEIPFSVRVPELATPGGHFGGVFLELKPVRPGETGVGVGYQVGAILNLRVAGEVIEEAQIREFRTDRGIYAKPEVAFTLRVENLGNVLLRPAGFLELTNMWGNKVANFTVNESGASVFPKSNRPYDIAWNGAWYAIGPHRAVLSLVYGDETRKTISAATSFWVLPIRLIAPVLGGIAGLVVLVWLLVTYSVRRKLREMQPVYSGARHQAPKTTRSISLHRLLRAVIILLVLILAFLIALFLFFA